MYNFYGICVLCQSPVLCGVVPRLYTQVSRAEVTTSNLNQFVSVNGWLINQGTNRLLLYPFIHRETQNSKTHASVLLFHGFKALYTDP